MHMDSRHLEVGPKPWKDRERKTLWYRAQVAFAVEKMREDLARRLPGAGITLTSNVDDANTHVQVERVNATLVRFSCGEREWALRLSEGRVVEARNGHW